MILKHDGGIVIPAQIDKFLVAKAFVARLNRVADYDSIDFAWQQLQKSSNVVRIELPPGRELPEDRPKLWAERSEALPKEI